ncbi:MAG: hypothetical protein IGS03_07575 [Candidatus Sericytochromatia bacterium]|nr:hypothetical protein [Candidatus Sericytochromatia bacterium]
MTQTIENERELLQLLLQLQLITRDQVTEALAYQCRLPPSQSRSLRDILVDLEFISETALIQAEQSFDTPADLRDSFQRAMDDILNQADLLQQQSAPVVPEPPRTRPAGQTPLTPPTQQERHPTAPPAQQASPPPAPAPPKPIVPPGSGLQAAGAFARRSPASQAGGWGAVSAPQAQPVIPPAPPAHAPPLGQILMQQKALEEWQLMHALSIQQSTAPRPRLGTLLVKLGYADQPTVARALSLQVQSRQ